jgi:hypothetical protein
MNREQAERLLREHKLEPVRGSTYLPEFISNWMIDAVIEAYDLGLRNGRLLARDWECG